MPNYSHHAMTIIDGSQGEGGGQMVRSALALALVTGRPCRIENIRAGRQKPGLRRQHLAAVEAAVHVGRAEVEGAWLGSRQLDFRPRDVRPGEFHLDVGTAGSTTLVTQTVLPALLTASGSARITVTGGTHNPLAPPFEFLAQAYLPLLERLGPLCRPRLVRPGFYPAGGGKIEVEVRPTARLGGLVIVERGPLVSRRLRATVARLPGHIAERECRTFLAESGWNDGCCEVIERHDTAGPGNALVAELAFEHLTEVFCTLGRLGLRAEEVARRLWREVSAYLAADAPVGPYLADQLMLPLGLSAWQGGGGEFRTTTISSHARTHADLLRRLLDVDIAIACEGPQSYRVRVG